MKIPVELANFDPAKGYKVVAQTLHTDPNPSPDSLETLEKLKKVIIAITAHAEPVPIWVVPGSSEKLIFLAEQRIKFKGKMSEEEIDVMVTRGWSLMSPVLYIIQPYSTLLMPCLELHSGGMSTIGDKGLVRKAYRYHRYALFISTNLDKYIFHGYRYIYAVHSHACMAVFLTWMFVNFVGTLLTINLMSLT